MKCSFVSAIVYNIHHSCIGTKSRTTKSRSTTNGPVNNPALCKCSFFSVFIFSDPFLIIIVNIFYIIKSKLDPVEEEDTTNTRTTRTKTHTPRTHSRKRMSQYYYYKTMKAL